MICGIHTDDQVCNILENSSSTLYVATSIIALRSSLHWPPLSSLASDVLITHDGINRNLQSDWLPDSTLLVSAWIVCRYGQWERSKVNPPPPIRQPLALRSASVRPSLISSRYARGPIQIWRWSYRKLPPPPPPMYIGDRSGRSVIPVDKARQGYLRHRLLECQESVNHGTLAYLV